MRTKKVTPRKVCSEEDAVAEKKVATKKRQCRREGYSEKSRLKTKNKKTKK